MTMKDRLSTLRSQLAAEAAGFQASVIDVLNPADAAVLTEMVAHELAGTLNAHLMAPLASALMFAGAVATTQRVVARSRYGNVRKVAAQLYVAPGEAATGATELLLQAECTDLEIDCPTTVARLTYGNGTAVLMVLAHYSVTGETEYELDDIAPVSIIINYGASVLA